MNIFSLNGQSALITGGGSGLGFGMAKCFVESGARVVLVGRRIDQLKEAVSKLGSLAVCVAHDITETERAAELIQAAEKAAGESISILVNNAGIHLKKPALDTSTEEFQSVLQTHVLGAHALTRAVLPRMIERKCGNIIFTASMASLFGIPQVIAYSAAKSAYLGMVRSLATEVSSQGIRVNAIAPGWIESAMSQNALNGDPARKQRILQRTPMAAFGEPSDVGWAAVYLCSPAAKFITGVTLPVDGGVSIGF